MVAALGTAAYVLASTGFWTLAGHMTWPRLLGLTLYLGLLAFSMIGAFSLIPQGALEGELGRNPSAGDCLQLAWLAASLATLAGALSSLIESDLAVREAAYGHRPSEGAAD